MRLDVVCSDPAGPVARHRVRALLPFLADAGFGDVRWHALPKRLRERVALFRETGGADVVLLLRKLFTRAELTLLRSCARRLVYDLDDAVMYRDSSRGRQRSHRRMRQFRAAARAADLVTAGNGYLLDHVRQWAPDTRAVLAPTPVDTERYRPGAAPGAGFRVGWIGSRSTRRYLRPLAAPLERLAALVPDVTLAVMADAAPAPAPPVPLDFRPWAEEHEVAFLQSLHVGVMPLPHDPWTLGKCGFKLLQYMACGVPVVASDVGVNAAIVDGGAAGLLATGDDGWVAALRSLAEDTERARELGALARTRVEIAYSTYALGPAYAAALAECARGA